MELDALDVGFKLLGIGWIDGWTGDDLWLVIIVVSVDLLLPSLDLIVIFINGLDVIVIRLTVFLKTRFLSF